MNKYGPGYCLKPKRPRKKPLTPAGCCVFLLSILSSYDGSSTWFKARSKKSGLHGIGMNSDVRLVTLTLSKLFASSQYMSSLSTRFFKKQKEGKAGNGHWEHLQQRTTHRPFSRRVSCFSKPHSHWFASRLARKARSLAICTSSCSLLFATNRFRL